MKSVLRERGVDLSQFTGTQMKELLNNMDDFKYDKTLVKRVL